MSEDGLDEELVEPFEAEPSEAGAGLPAIKAPRSRRSFARVRREMTDDELTHPAVQKLLLDELDRIDRECEDYKAYVDKFNEADRRVCVLEERAKPKVAADVVFGGCSAIGSVLIGLMPTLFSAHPHISYVVAALGLITIGLGVVTKVILK